MSAITGCAPNTPPTSPAASTASVAPAPPLYEATAQPAPRLDKVEISDAARARLASDQQQEQKYVAQLSASREQTSIT
jgi:hypothetical protein